MSTAVAPKREAGCDWCGQPFIGQERRVAGYDGTPTHERCGREARRAYREDQIRLHGEPANEREPFTDWPNGQGTYD